MSPELRHTFPGFYDNPVIELLADVQRWTISDKDKRPVDFRALFGENTPQHAAIIRGAMFTDQRCLVSLPELTNRLPNAANHAYYLQAPTDGVMILDIESDCPADTRDQLLQLPSLYAETSLSGRGYHLVMPLPKNFHEYPIATEKPVLQHKEKHFEILIHHWVTFTRNIIPHNPWGNISQQHQVWDDLYASLAVDAKPSTREHLDISDQKPDIPHEEQILHYLCKTPLNKTLDDFNNDHSRYEFSVLGTIYNHLTSVLNYLSIAGVVADPQDYDETMRIWLIYLAATHVIEYRPKHDEVRSGMPLLFDRAVFIYAGRTNQEAQQQQQSA